LRPQGGEKLIGHWHESGPAGVYMDMTNLKRIEWHGGSSAHLRDRRPPSQRALVEASLVHAAPARPRWDERRRIEHTDRAR
jgi:hypothetical protein